MQRQEYLHVTLEEQPAAHRQYYSQFVTDDIKQRVIQVFTLEKLVKSFKKDEAFNTNLTPIRQWDSLTYFYRTRAMSDAFRAYDDWMSESGLVCILKEAAHQVVEEVQQ